MAYGGAIDLLNSYRDTLQQIEDVNTDIRIIEDRLTSITASYDAEPVSGGDPLDRKRETEARLADLLGQRQYLQRMAETRRNDIMQFLAVITDRKYRQVLELRYCDLKTVKQTAEIMGYSIPHIYRMQSDALVEATNNWRMHRR